VVVIVPLPRGGTLVLVGGAVGLVADCARTREANVRKVLTSSRMRKIENDMFGDGNGKERNAKSAANAHYKYRQTRL
jgi:hypothetical protein